MNKDRWQRSKTAVYNLSFHLIWCPKYRRPILVDKIALRLSELLKEKADFLEIEIVEKTIQPDHVHLFIRSKPTLPPHYILNQLKGYSSRILRQEFPSLKSRLPSLWTRSYYIDSVGKLNEYTIRKYIENQKKN
jgi:putative transposase